MAKAKKNLKFLKIILCIIFVIGLIFLSFLIYEKVQKNRFKKMLQESDATNYELTEIVNGEETKVYVRDKTLLIEEGTTKTWVSELDSERVAFDDKYKTAVWDQNDEDLKVNSLNYTYIHDFFENSDQKFKYLGKEKEYYKLQFKEKGSKKITLLYLNVETKLIDKMIQNVGNFEFVTEFKVEKNAVSKDKIAFPNLEGYRAYDSVNSKPEQ